jgi:hypothetical protein
MPAVEQVQRRVHHGLPVDPGPDAVALRDDPVVEPRPVAGHRGVHALRPRPVVDHAREVLRVVVVHLGLVAQGPGVRVLGAGHRAEIDPAVAPLVHADRHPQLDVAVHRVAEQVPRAVLARERRALEEPFTPAARRPARDRAVDRGARRVRDQRGLQIPRVRVGRQVPDPDVPQPQPGLAVRLERDVPRGQPLVQRRGVLRAVHDAAIVKRRAVVDHLAVQPGGQLVADQPHAVRVPLAGRVDRLQPGRDGVVHRSATVLRGVVAMAVIDLELHPGERRVAVAGAAEAQPAVGPLLKVELRLELEVAVHLLAADPAEPARLHHADLAIDDAPGRRVAQERPSVERSTVEQRCHRTPAATAVGERGTSNRRKRRNSDRNHRRDHPNVHPHGASGARRGARVQGRGGMLPRIARHGPAGLRNAPDRCPGNGDSAGAGILETLPRPGHRVGRPRRRRPDRSQDPAAHIGTGRDRTWRTR